MRYLVDYQGMAEIVPRGPDQGPPVVLAVGLLRLADEKPFTLDVAKAKALLAEAGYPDGFEVELDALNTSPYTDIAQAIQATMAEAGIKVRSSRRDRRRCSPSTGRASTR